MNDPYQILGLPADASDEAIRKRYLELVRENPPERAPEKFAAIRDAYDALKDLETRLTQRVFFTEKTPSIESIVEELQCKSSRPRMSLKSLMELSKSR